jgi:predicted glycogen debranching enzyme
MSTILGRDTCGNWESASRHEWLVTNGLGGFASGTVSGANTRRYHGFLVASRTPPVGRVLLVSKIELRAEYLGQVTDLSANEFADGAISGQGFVYIESFRLDDGIPTWVYALGDALLQVQIFMAPGRNTSYLRLQLLRSSAPLRLTLKPLVTYRGYHNQNRGAQSLEVQAAADGFSVQAPADARPYRLSITHGGFAAAPEWYWNFWRREEAERGLDAAEDLLMPGYFSTELMDDRPVYVIATAESSAPAAGPEVEAELRLAARRQWTPLPQTAPPWIRALALAADQFVVRRSAGGASIIAGYPWFTDWGRDTMISLPGLATALRRYDLAADILKTYAGFVDRGMLPNCFPEEGQALEYNTVDATLWMFHALDDYLQARRDPELIALMFPLLLAIVHAHADGTRYGIRVDPADGLLCAGEPGTQLTWMDAKHGDRTFTPRIGKPVEINALWLNALDVTVRLAARLRESAEKSFCEALFTRASASFARFWNEERGCLYDVIDVDGGKGVDGRIRPNQILAVSLPYCPLSLAQQRSIVERCGRELLTSQGLRSLSPQEPGYVGRYQGDAAQRDAAYHMGTVWGWLLGPFSRAHFRVHGDARLAQSFLDPMSREIHAACLGTLGEIFDGDPPHTARGCFAQAWSVAEILRSWIHLERKVSGQG